MPVKSICIVAGEPSGDLQGSLLVTELRRRHPDWIMWGVGSDKMRAAGCALWEDARTWAVMGFSQVIRSLPKFHRRLNALEREIETRRPDGVILIDFPGFNLKLAKRVNQLGIPVMYYIVPQLWAWGHKRINVFKRHVDRTIVVFPFEKEYFDSRGVAVDWIGHPLVDHVRSSATRDELRTALGILPTEKLIALLPGSRQQDFESHLPLFTDAVVQIGDRIPGIRWALGLAPALADQIRPFLQRSGREPMPVTTAIYDLITAADLALTKTGTATIECALLGTPMVAVYRTGWANFLIARMLVKVPFVAMPNLIANQRIVPELVQHQATPLAIADESIRLLTNTAARRAQVDALQKVRERLGPPGAVGRAVDIIGGWLGA